nr:hypothetical protein MACL_00001320 [Theileria orientalis]
MFSLKEDKLMNITVEFNNPFTKFIYLLMPNWAKKIMKKSVLSSNSLKKKREMVQSLRWSGPRSLPHVNALQLFSYEQYEWLYVKWMHSFNRHFYNSTLFEMIVIIFYSSTGTILLGYRHYLTLSETDKGLYIGKTSRLVTMALRFILYPIISLILIMAVGYILLNQGTTGTAGDGAAVGDRAGKSANAMSGAAVKAEQPSVKGDLKRLKKPGKARKNKGQGNKQILWVYWLMMLLCMVDFVGSMFDVFVSLGLETPPYAVHNSLVMQFLMTKTAAFLLLRFPTLFVLYLVYFVGLFTAQFFLKHTNTLRFITMQVSCQLIIGVGSWSFLIRPVDLNRRRVFSDVILPYVLYLSNFLR